VLVIHSSFFIFNSYKMHEATQQILSSWHTNAAAWIAAIEGEAIESRKLVTNAAIVNTLLELKPQRMLDIGCGEGWLCRAMTLQGVQCTGWDAVPALVAAAAAKGGGDYAVKIYSEIAAQDFVAGLLYDVAVFNFALFEDDAAVIALLRGVKKLLQPAGKLVIQTLHPSTAKGDAPYQSGWREGSWAGFSTQFKAAAPWYYRITEDWVRVLNEAGYLVQQVHEPQHPESGLALSLVLVAEGITQR
jgi:2-polyprenyl-3-methyl-5-hydroxy-6-metoxy-1,4-benzoquinol methylase